MRLSPSAKMSHSYTVNSGGYGAYPNSAYPSGGVYHNNGQHHEMTEYGKNGSKRDSMTGYPQQHAREARKRTAVAVATKLFNLRNVWIELSFEHQLLSTSYSARPQFFLS